MNEGKETLYIGETGKSSYRRGKNHVDGWRRGEDGNVLQEHFREVHEDEKIPDNDDFSMKVTGEYKSSLARQTSEGILINQQLEKTKVKPNTLLELLNSRSEFHQPKLIRSKIGKINYDEKLIQKVP